MNVPAWGLVGALLLSVPPAVPAQTPAELVQSYVGQKRILRHAREKKTWKLKWEKLAKLKGGRDAAVEIVDAAFSDTAIRFRLAFIGTALVPRPKKSGEYRVDTLKSAPAEVILSRVPASIDSAILLTELDRVLQTAEVYLEAHGLSFPAQRSADPNEPVLRWDSDNSMPANAKREKLLLQVMPYEKDAEWMARNQPEVEAEFIVGSDGRVRHPRVVKGAGTRYAQELLRALDLWRFEPAQLDGRPVAVYSKFTMQFRLR